MYRPHVEQMDAAQIQASIDPNGDRGVVRDYVADEDRLIYAIAALRERDPRRDQLLDSLWQLRHTLRERCPLCGHQRGTTDTGGATTRGSHS